jgi:hypothetical protein
MFQTLLTEIEMLQVATDGTPFKGKRQESWEEPWTKKTKMVIFLASHGGILMSINRSRLALSKTNGISPKTRVDDLSR